MKNRTVKPTTYVQKLEPYKLVSHKAWEHSYNSDHETLDSTLKLDWNEATNIPGSILRKILKYMLAHKIRLNWYPDIHNSILLNKLSKYVELPAKNIQYFNGSDGALEYVARAYIEPGHKVVISSPTYDNFRVYAESCGGKTLNYFNDSAFEKNVDKLTKFLEPIKPRMVYIVNPNNPTGLLYHQAEIEKLLRKFKSTLFVIDEAYFEFCNVSCVALVKKYENILVSRTFTKAFGLGGFRLGYVVASENIINGLNKIRVGKNVNTFAQTAGIIALDNKQYMKDYVKQINLSKEFLVDRLTQSGLEVKDTPANFILIKCKKPLKAVGLLKKANVFVRDRSTRPQLERYIRVTVGDGKTTEEFFKRFKNVFEKNKSCFF